MGSVGDRIRPLVFGLSARLAGFLQRICPPSGALPAIFFFSRLQSVKPFKPLKKKASQVP